MASGLPAWRSTSLAARSTRSTAGSFGVQKAANSSGIDAAPPHWLGASNSMGMAVSASAASSRCKRSRTSPRVLSVRSRRNSPFKGSDKSSMRSTPPGCRRSIVHAFAAANGGLAAKVRRRFSSGASAMFSTRRSRSAGRPLSCAARLSFGASSPWTAHGEPRSPSGVAGREATALDDLASASGIVLPPLTIRAASVHGRALHDTNGEFTESLVNALAEGAGGC